MSSHNTETERTLRAFIPTRFELIALPSTSLLFLTLSNSFELLRSVDGRNYLMVINFMEAQVKSFLGVIDRLIGATAPLVVFWMFVGIIVYILLWLGMGAYSTYKNDLPSEKGMIVPANYNHARVLRGSIVHLLVRILAGGLLLIWLYLLFAEVLPYASEIFLKGIEKISLKTLYYGALSALVLSAWLFTITVLARCVMLRDRIFG